MLTSLSSPFGTHKDICTTSLKRRILRRDLLPGGELEEVSLAAEFGLSRTPLREVLRLLAAEGYVQLAHNRGARVAAIDLDRFATFLRTAPALMDAIVTLACESKEAEAQDALITTLGEIDVVIESDEPAEAALADHVLLAQIVGLADNAYLEPAISRVLIDQTRLIHGFFGPDGKKERKALKKLMKAQAMMVRAVTSGDASLARDSAAARWTLIETHLRGAFDAKALPLVLPAPSA